MADPASIFDTPTLAADLATAGFTLVGAALEYVEAFTKLILRNKPAAVIALERAVAEQQSGEEANAGETVNHPRPSALPWMRSGAIWRGRTSATGTGQVSSRNLRVASREHVAGRLDTPSVVDEDSSHLMTTYEGLERLSQKAAKFACTPRGSPAK